MKTATRASLWTALIIGVLGVVVVGSNVIAARQARKLGLEDEGVVHASANSRRIRATASTGPHGIVVRRKGKPTITFTDDAAVTYELASTWADLRRFEVAVHKDLAHGDFRARRTRLAVAASLHPGQTPAEEFVSTRRELRELKTALRQDLANGDFRARHTLREVATTRDAPSAVGDNELATGVVTLSDDLWDLKLAVERDIHAGDLKAIETHFAIDRRRWKVH